MDTDPNWSSVSALSKREILEEGGPWRQFEETLEDSSAARIQHPARGQAGLLPAGLRLRARLAGAGQRERLRFTNRGLRADNHKLKSQHTLPRHSRKFKAERPKMLPVQVLSVLWAEPMRCRR